MLSLDLHTHSTASDGTLSPSDLVRLARSAKLRVLALTDHDTLEGLHEAHTAARALGLGFVPGVEISVTWERVTVGEQQQEKGSFIIQMSGARLWEYVECVLPDGQFASISRPEG